MDNTNIPNGLPYEQLAKLGIDQHLADSLPEDVKRNLSRGELTPLMEVSVKATNGIVVTACLILPLGSSGYLHEKRFLPTVKPLRLYKREKNQKQFNQKIKTMEFIKLIPNRKKEILWTALRYAGELALTLLLFGAMYVLLILAYAEGLPM